MPGQQLATLNAVLNAASAVLLLVGWWAIRSRRIPVHRAAMHAAFVTSVLFLVSYLTRAWLTGTHRFPGGGLLKTAYLVVLFSHMVLAVVVVPLVLRTLFLARAARFDEHRRIARITLPVWIYVSITGVLVYVMLYHLA